MDPGDQSGEDPGFPMGVVLGWGGSLLWNIDILEGRQFFKEKSNEIPKSLIHTANF